MVDPGGGIVAAMTSFFVLISDKSIGAGEIIEWKNRQHAVFSDNLHENPG